MTQPCGYASAVLGADVVAVGRATVDSDWAGVFGMATLPAARGKGAARGVLAALAQWAGARAVGGMYLQVERDNLAALQLYQEAGFGEVCRYWHRAGNEPQPQRRLPASGAGRVQTTADRGLSD